MTPREVLARLRNAGNPHDSITNTKEFVETEFENITQALSDLAEIVMEKQKEITPPWGDDVTLEKAQQIYDKQLAERIYNQAITDIAKLFTDKEKTK